MSNDQNRCTYTLSDVINEAMKDPEFVKHYRREILISQIAKQIVQARKKDEDRQLVKEII